MEGEIKTTPLLWDWQKAFIYFIAEEETPAMCCEKRSAAVVSMRKPSHKVSQADITLGPSTDDQWDRNVIFVGCREVF